MFYGLCVMILWIIMVFCISFRKLGSFETVTNRHCFQMSVKCRRGFVQTFRALNTFVQRRLRFHALYYTKVNIKWRNILFLRLSLAKVASCLVALFVNVLVSYSFNEFSAIIINVLDIHLKTCPCIDNIYTWKSS